MTDDEVAQIRPARAERAAGMVPLACGAVWTAAEIMHLAGWPGSLDTALATAAATGLAYGVSARRGWTWRLPAWIAGTGGWLCLAVAEGPLYGWPYPALTGVWAVGTWFAWRSAHKHEAVVAAREWREARADWLARSRNWGLGGSHLLDYERTRLGERYVADVKGTRKRASQIAASSVAELIAEEESLPVSRVQVKAGRIAGRVEISVRHEDPWAKPILHPVLDSDPEIDLSGPYSIRKPATVGQDPETGRPLEVPLWDERGGKNLNIVAIKGAGKTILLNNLSERITKASDALQVRINLSVKGHAEAARWGTACHLTALGPQQKSRAVQVLRAVSGIIEWRAQQTYATDVFTPRDDDPLITVILDEADSAMAVPAVRQLVDNIATKGREYGVTLIRAGQRGTTDYGSAKTRAQDDVFCIGMVNRTGEVYHAAGNLGLSLPDMASYGDGRSGVWVIAEPGGSQHTGRTFLLKDPGDVAKIAEDRAFSQPELPAACREYLGESYEVLLSTDVFAKWARERKESAPSTALPHPEPGAAPQPSAAPLVTLTADDINHLDWEPDMDDDARRRLAEIDAKLGRVRETIAGTVALPKPPEVTPEQLAASTAERWRQVGEQAEISPEHREILLGLLKTGTTISAVAEALGVTKWTARTYLERLRNEGVARVEGVKRAARWRLADLEPQGGDA